ncbi:MAG: beta-lactamase family protein, partial [Balneolia bacterium]|nr:beta-lactamase family protein [Balneolia bacterium]
EYEYAPGETFSYSNMAYMLLGYLVEELSGTDFDAFISERIAQPIGMNMTMRVVPEGGGYMLAEGSAFGEPAASWHFDELRGLGELRSTTNDMIRYLMAHSGKLNYAYADVVQKSHQAVYEMREGRSMSPGWFVYMMEDGEKIVGHGGGTGGYRSFAAFSAETGRAAVVLTNSNTEVADIAMNLINTTFPLREMPVYDELDSAIASAIVGIYVNEQIGAMSITHEEGVIRGRIQGQPALPIEFVEGFTFRNAGVGAVIEFKEPENGLSAAFTLKQGGMEFEFTRTDEAPSEPEVIEMSREELEEYTGHFDSNIGLSYEISAADGYLSARIIGQPFASVYPEGDDRFFYRAVPASMVFSRGENGDVVSVTLYQGGQEISFSKRSE